MAIVLKIYIEDKILFAKANIQGFSIIQIICLLKAC